MPTVRRRRQATLPADSGPTYERPSKRLFLRLPDNYYDLSDAERDAVCDQLADIFNRELRVDEINE